MPVKFSDELITSCDGKPPQGCRFCDRGAKLVLYITGICRQECFYCPLSEKKKGKDIAYANERLVEGKDWLEQVIDEAKRMKALGTGITGGDPMVVPDRTVKVMKKLKEEFGKGHHIHLYTSGPFDPDLLEDFKEAGLNEIRFHPPIETWSDFEFIGKGAHDGDGGSARPYHDMIMKAVSIGLVTGLEIPAVVDGKGEGYGNSRGLFTLVDYAIRQDLSFVNINELEASHTNMPVFMEKGFELVGDSMAVKGSRELALSVISRIDERYPKRKRTVLHLCTSVYKDAIQLRHRLKRMADNLKRPFEIVTEDGTYLRGVIEPDDINETLSILEEEFGVPTDLYLVERSKILIAPWVLEEIAGDLNGVSYISEVYPTWDGLEVERIPLQKLA